MVWVGDLRLRVHTPGRVYLVMLRRNGGQDIYFLAEAGYGLHLLLDDGVERCWHRLAMTKQAGVNTTQYRSLTLMTLSRFRELWGECAHTPCPIRKPYAGAANVTVGQSGTR
jgi:hypothetical protein